MEGLGVKMNNRRMIAAFKEDGGVFIQMLKLVDKDLLKKYPQPNTETRYFVKNIMVTEIELSREGAESLHALLENLLYNQKETK